MPLPKIVTPEFSTTLPSTGEEIFFRPFLVKEEKVLLMAQQGKDPTEIQRAVINILEECIKTPLKVDTLPLFDIEYLFLQLRSKSVGEVIEVNLDKWEVSDRFKTGKGPYNLEITPNGKLLIGTIKSEGKTAIWNLENKEELAIIKNTTSVSHGIAISSDSKYAFISVEGIGGEPGIVDVIDLDSYELVSSVKVGKQAGGIAFWKKERTNNRRLG